MKDLTLGDAHFIPIDDLMQRDVGSDMVCPLFQVHVCICICSLLPWQPKLSTSGLGDCKVARVGRPTTDYKLVVRPWESGIRSTMYCISCHFPTV